MKATITSKELLLTPETEDELEKLRAWLSRNVVENKDGAKEALDARNVTVDLSEI